MTRDAALQIAGLRKSFGSLDVLRGIDITVPHREVRAIIGPNGAGKTTLINVVTGVYSASSGSVLLDGSDITCAKPHTIARRGMIRTYQIARLFLELTVAQNVQVASHAAQAFRRGIQSNRDAVRENLQLVGLQHLAERRVAEISHGDQRLLEVAISTALSPQLLLLDEPTAGMSPAETRNFIDLINEKLRGRCTIVLVEHDMQVVMRTADKISVLAAGVVLAEGSPEQIKADRGVQEAYLGSSFAH